MFLASCGSFAAFAPHSRRILTGQCRIVPSTLHRHALSGTTNAGGGCLSTAMKHFQCHAHHFRSMGTVTEGVAFDTIAREWRCKWSTDDDKASLKAAQSVFEEYLNVIKGTAGVKSVHRIVCGGNLDFKIIVALDEVEFRSWSDVGFTPELSFLDKLKMIDGIHTVETQTYTFMET
mmetsp:Transcript_48546/g.117429  ORF Transcript_48546/g.117429 Transcript_48546/m.117429 type:complete len:176 (-) Transcript_48546:194-721(-)